MPALRRTIRLFVSSTFSDMKSERDVLQRDVFPKLRQFCLSNGLRFQPIDLRWGVPEEADRDNRTMWICLRELKRCQEGRTKPNFLILLGNRYGWKPLPEIIPADLFAQLRDRLPAAMQALFEWRDTQPADANGWYRRDDNAVPPIYELRPRGDDERWHETVEQPLLHALEAGTRQIGIDTEMHGVAIGPSATEQEIVEGVLEVDDARDHVHAFFRSISGLPHDQWPQDFVDGSNDGTRDSVATARLDALKTRIEAKLGATNVHRYTVPWREGGVQPPDLAQFGQDVYAALKDVILRQIADLTSTSREAQEEQAHLAFGDERCRGFIGRTEPLAHIAACMRGGDREVLALVGPPGSGKSALMAEAVRRARETYGEDAVLARFIGATPNSANVLPLLGNLVAEIRRRYPAPPPAAGQLSKDGDVPVDINPLTVAFHEALARPTVERPLFVFLDALDQLVPGNGALECHWLPGAFNPYVRVILSAAWPAAADAIPGQEAADSPAPFLSARDPRAVVMAALDRRAPQVQQIRLQPLSTADGRILVAQWLADAGRSLRPAQKEAILASFAPEGSPLWLRVAIGESQRLASWDSAPEFDPALPGLLRQVLDRLSAKDEHGAVLVERALAGIASTRHGLAEDEVMDVLSADKEIMKDFHDRSPTERLKPEAERIKALPVAVWVRFHGDIAPYLAERQLQNAALLGFYHRSFLEAVQAAFLGTAERQRAAHQRLANYFRARTWFIAPVAEEGGAPRAAALADPPDTRKASELPWQMLRVANASDPAREQPAEWDAPAAVLCDIEFLEAKCRAGLVFELQEDYRDAGTALPEAQTIFREEQRRTEGIGRWTGEIIRYSRAWSERRGRIARGERVDETEPVLPAIPAASRIWTDEEIEAECRRIREAPARLDRLATFAGFIQGECDPLIRFGGRAGFTLQQAINHAPGGPVHDAAHGVLPECGPPLLLRRWPTAATWSPKPAILGTLEGHSDPVWSVSVTPDGRRAVSGSGDTTLRVWDLDSGACLRTLEGHSGSVTGVCVTPDGRHAVSGSRDETARVWDLETGANVRVLEGHSGYVYSVSVTPDGRRAVSGSDDATLRVWDLESGRCERTLEGHSDLVWSVSVTPDGRRAVSGSDDKTLRVWDLESGRCERTLEAHSRAVLTVSVTPDGRRAVSGSDDATLRVWDLDSGRCEHTLEGHSDLVWSVSVTPDGRHAVSGSGDTTLRVWDLDSGRCERTLKGHSGWVRNVTLMPFLTVSVTPDGRRAVSGSDDNTVRVWDLESGRCEHTLEGHSDAVSSVSVTPDGRRAVSGSADVKPLILSQPQRAGPSGASELRVWDLESGQCLHTLEGHSGWVRSVSVTPDGRRAVSGSDDATLRVWDLDSGACLLTLEGHSKGVTIVSVTPDGQRTVSGSTDATLRVWDLESGRCERTLEGHSGVVNSASVTPDGRRAVSGSADATLRVWDLESGRCEQTLRRHNVMICSVSVTPDGRRAVSGSWDAIVQVWDLKSGACLHELAGHTRAVTRVCVTADGRRAVSQSEDATLRVWDLERGRCERTLDGHSGSVASVSVTPDGRRAVSGSWDKTLRVWDLDSGVCLAVFVATTPVGVVASSSGLLTIGTCTGQVLSVEMHNLPPGPAIAPDTSDEAYEALLRRGLDHSRREKTFDYEERLAYLEALTVHLKKMGKTDEAQLSRCT